MPVKCLEKLCLCTFHRVPYWLLIHPVDLSCYQKLLPWLPYLNCPPSYFVLITLHCFIFFRAFVTVWNNVTLFTSTVFVYIFRHILHELAFLFYYTFWFACYSVSSVHLFRFYYLQVRALMPLFSWSLCWFSLLSWLKWDNFSLQNLYSILVFENVQQNHLENF